MAGWSKRAAIAAPLCLILMAVGILVFSTWHEQNQQCAGIAGDSTVPLPAGDTGAPLNLRVATWNTLHSNRNMRVVTGIKAIGEQADVIGLQELDAGSRRSIRKEQFMGTFAVSAADNAVQILWKRARFDVLAQGSQKIFDVRPVERGVGGTSFGPKWLDWVELRDREMGAVFVVANHHLLPSIEHRGHPDRNRPKRLALYSRQMSAMLALVDRFRSTAPVMVTGDFNVNAQTDAQVRSPIFAFVEGAAHGLYSNWRVLGYPRGGTEGHRVIDYVWSTTATAAPVAQRILGKHGSDHSAVVVAISNRGLVAQQPQKQASDAEAASTSRALPQSFDATRREQIANLRLIQKAVLEVVRPDLLPAGTSAGRVTYLAAVAAVGESDLINVNYGDRAGPDSRGLFQQRTSWGSLAQRMDPVYATKSFLLGPGQHGSGGLLDLNGWAQLPVTIAIHRVQINADPQHYAKFEARTREIAADAGVNFDAGAVTSLAGSLDGGGGCLGQENGNGLGLPMSGGTGGCPLDSHAAAGHTNPSSCDQAITFLQREMVSRDRVWRRRCLALVARAYGWNASGIPTAFQAAQVVIAASQMHTDRDHIPRGAVLWWDGRATGNAAGHVAIYDGGGYILSNDVPVTDGRVGRVPWTYPEDRWGQKWIGWSPPYFPRAV